MLLLGNVKSLEHSYLGALNCWLSRQRGRSAVAGWQLLQRSRQRRCGSGRCRPSRPASRPATASPLGGTAWSGRRCWCPARQARSGAGVHHDPETALSHLQKLRRLHGHAGCPACSARAGGFSEPAAEQLPVVAFGNKQPASVL